VGDVKFHVESGILFITLPSRRKLSYIKPKMELNKFGREAISYEGIGENKQWCRMSTYGGRLVENIVQAVARDCLAHAMLRVDKYGYKIAMHVHDEVVITAPVGDGSLEEVCDIMGQPISWAEGLPLRAAGFEADFYKKS
jgi:DNA polymerase